MRSRGISPPTSREGTGSARRSPTHPPGRRRARSSRSTWRRIWRSETARAPHRQAAAPRLTALAPAELVGHAQSAFQTLAGVTPFRSGAESDLVTGPCSASIYGQTAATGASMLIARVAIPSASLSRSSPGRADIASSAVDTQVRIGRYVYSALLDPQVDGMIIPQKMHGEPCVPCASTRANGPTLLSRASSATSTLFSALTIRPLLPSKVS
jgi:hypothetical protein